MATYEITFTNDYVGWGIWECCREVIQNCLDAHDAGYKMKVDFSSPTSISFLNRGAKLHKNDLVLGHSSANKRDDKDARGTFGEGMKLAFARLHGMGISLTVYTGTGEIWTPEVGVGKQFSVPILLVHTKKSRNRRAHEGVEIVLENMSPALCREAKEELEKNCLYFRGGYKSGGVTVGNVELFEDSHRRPSLYVGGLYVDRLHSAEYSANVKGLELDRDRNMFNEYSLGKAIVEAMDTLSPVEMVELVSEWKLGPVIRYSIPNKWITKYKRGFLEIHGEDAYPISCDAEREAAIASSKSPIQVGELAEVLRKHFTLVIEQGKLAAVRVYSRDELGQWADKYYEVVEKIALRLGREITLEFVDYHDWSGGSAHGLDRIRLSKHLLYTTTEGMSTLVHELGHIVHGYDDADSRHKDDCCWVAAVLLQDR